MEVRLIEVKLLWTFDIYIYIYIADFVGFQNDTCGLRIDESGMEWNRMDGWMDGKRGV